MRLADAYVFANPGPVTARTLPTLLSPGQNTQLVLDALHARYARHGVVLAEANDMWAFRTALILQAASSWR